MIPPATQTAVVLMSSSERSELNSGAGERQATNLGPDPASEMQALFLVRLSALLEKRDGKAPGTFNPEQRRLLDKAIYSTFRDCIDLNVSSQARSLLRQSRGN